MFHWAKKFYRMAEDGNINFDYNENAVIIISSIKETIKSNSTCRILNYMNKLLNNSEYTFIVNNQTHFKICHDNFSKNKKNEWWILCLTIISMVIGVFTILYSIYILTRVHTTYCLPAGCLFNGGLILSFLSIVFMLSAIFMSLKEMKIETIELVDKD